jgi:hypothetical protein
MSNYDGPRWLREDETIQALPVASGTVIEVGDMVKLSGGNLEPCGATTDNLVFIGVAKEAHTATDPADQLSVAIRNAHSVYRATLDAAATIAVGANLQLYTSDPEKKLTPSDTDPVAVCVKGGTSVTEVDVIFTLPATTNGPRLVGEAS